jgi:hypothetical protein
VNWVELLDTLACLDAEDAAGRGNLVGAGLLALREFGVDEGRLQHFAAGWAHRLPPAPPPAVWPAGDAWAGRFGQRGAWPVYRALFTDWIDHEGATDVLAQVLPQLWPGCGAAGLQALVRAASAVRTGHRGEVADALAWWACRWLALPAAAPLSGRASAPVEDPVVLLRKLRATGSTARRFDQRLRAVAAEGAAARAAARLVIDERTPARLAAAAAVACAGSGAHPVAQWLVSATHAVRVLARFVDEPERAWQAYAPVFLHAAVAAGWRAQAPAPRDAAQREPTPAWDEIVAAACALDDPLALICIESCRAEERDLALAGQTLWRAAAAQVLAAATVPAARRARTRR